LKKKTIVQRTGEWRFRAPLPSSVTTFQNLSNEFAIILSDFDWRSYSLHDNLIITVSHTSCFFMAIQPKIIYLCVADENYLFFHSFLICILS